MESVWAILSNIWRNPSGRIGLVLVTAILLFAVLGPVLSVDPNKIAIPDRFQTPSITHPLGTDNLGRDLFARTAKGSQSALIISLLVVAASLLAGSILGILAGTAGGFVDRGITAIFDIISAYPAVILAMGLVALYGTGFGNLLFVVTILFIPQFGRMARAQTLSLRHQPFIDAERILGLPTRKLILRHFMPNVLGPLIVLASMNIPVVITIEAGLSFLGLGVQPPQASLGSLIKDGYIYLNQSWWPTIGSAVTLALATLGSTLFGEALRDAADPKLKGHGR
ncbi:MAG TPA: ABC transporter permease [Dongiaceae bacterium]|jgi:peptide/nickel transport system permease protein|nr:ABC transporter permease [Dongiaceae bacterium]